MKSKPDAPWLEFLKGDLWDEFEKMETDQRKGLPPPPLEKPFPPESNLVDLVAPHQFRVGNIPLIEAIRCRRSRREFTSQPLSLEEASFLLWATQGVSRTGTGPEDVLWRGATVLRTIPSGGARHPFETYLLVRRVVGLAQGLYRYLPLEHKLLFLSAYEPLEEKMDQAWGTRRMLCEAAVVFIWTAIPYRTAWRYGALTPKLVAQDSGHLCQNLYLACEAIDAGTCAVGAYSQVKLDALVGVDGENEFVVYLAPVGKIHS